LRRKHKTLLIIDGIINLVLGALLLSFPWGTAAYLGVPQAAHSFYPTILGGVIFGIGVALLIEIWGAGHAIPGLGLAGAIAINFCGAGVLILWLMTSPLNIPTRGYIVLWSIAICVFGIGAVELLTGAGRYDRDEQH
jgi:hypothetical protein